MATISLCMIVKNEEEVLRRCLDSIKEIVDEIIIVDTGSVDKTKEIALEYTEQVYDFEWIDDFAAARNFSFSKAKKDYVMWLDADDVLLEEDQEKLKHLKETLEPFIITVMMKYNTAFDQDGNPTFSYYRERLIRRQENLKWEGQVHEVIAPIRPILYSDIAISHRKLKVSDPERNLKIFENLISQGKKLEPRLQFYFGRELYYNAYYNRAIQILEEFLNTKAGWIENCIETCKFLSYCYLAVNEDDKAIQSLFNSFEYDLPRAEICCEIGQYFLNKNRPQQAAYWYQSALNCEKDETSGAFISEDCYGYLPSIQLCVCYDRLGESEKAQFYNEQAAQFKPNDPSVSLNRVYFQNLKLREEK